MADRGALLRHTSWSAVILVLVALVLALWRLDVAPPLFWDEGWTLMIARNWVERGRYGRLLAGEIVPAGLSAAPSVVASIALSFRLFGVGIWQARLVIVLYTVALLWLLYYLARRLYSPRIATATLAVALLMNPVSGVHPLYVGRAVWADAPMLFFLVAGYVCFLLTLQRSVWFMPLAVLCWGIALYTKAQPRPFWTASLVIPLFLLLLRRKWRVAGLFSIALIGSLGVRELLPRLWQLLMGPGTLRGYAIPGLTSAVALVPVPHVRLVAVQVALIVGIPTVLGLGHAMWESIQRRNQGTSSAEVDAVRWALLILVGSWFAWYLLLSLGFPRYVFPATFLGSVFVAALLHDLSDGFNLSSTVRRGGGALRRLRFDQQGIRALLAVVLPSLVIPLTIQMLGSFCLADVNTSVHQVADFLNTQTAPNVLIEAYSSELFFLLDRRYHYPPDEVNAQLIRRASWREDVSIDYDPLSADPDYLVVCRLYSSWRHGPLFPTSMVYDPVLGSGAFRLLRVIEPYEIYERVR